MFVADIAQFFLLSVALGLAVYSLLASTKLTGVGLYKVILGLIAGSLVISGMITAINTGALNVSVLSHLGALAIIGPLYLLHQDQRNKFTWILYLLKVISIVITSYLVMGNVQNFAFYLSSCAILGVVTYAMVLGHWYLVTPKLTEKPLAVAMILLWAIMAFKVPGSIYQYFTHQDYFQQGTGLGMGYTFNWIMLLMRMVWGYVIIGVMSYYAYRLIKMRSLQSATGILYVMTFFIFIGELISSYFYYQYGLAL